MQNKLSESSAVEAETEGENWYADDAATFGDRVTAGREALGLSEIDLARQLGVTTDTLAAWEQDMSGPRANRLQMLAAVLNVSMRWLVTGEGDAPSDLQEIPIEAASGLLDEVRALRSDAERVAARLAALEARLGEVMGRGQ